MATLDDISHWFGGDLFLSPAGDLARANQVLKSQQRVVRRLMTQPGTYLSHLTYGAGISGWIGRLADTDKLTGVIKGQMQLEPTVSQTNPISVTITWQPGGTFGVNLAYTVAPEQIPTSLSFTVSE